MLKGKTSTGFQFEIAEGALDNYELVEALADIETDPLSVTKVVTLLLGKEQKEKLKDHVRNDKGVVTTTALMKEIEEVFKTQNKVKK